MIKNAKAWVDIYHRDKYKTAIQGSEHNLYMIVTRVNHLTASLWLDYRNKLVNKNKDFMTLKDKPNWLVMCRNFRRRQDEEINKL